MAIWNEPKSDYTPGDEVVPEIFNELAENEKHLKEITCQIETKKKTGETKTINCIVLVEV